MATTFVDYTGDGNNNKTFSFPSYQVSDIKVQVNTVLKTSGTHYNIENYSTTGGGTVVFTTGNIPASGVSMRIYRDTDVDAAKATYTAGSAVKAGDLNNNQTQLLYAAQEEQNQTITTDKIKDLAVTNAKIANYSIENSKLVQNSITASEMAANSVTASELADDAVDTAAIADDAVTQAKIADDAVGADQLASSAVVTASIVDSNVTTAKIADSAVTSAKIADGTIATADLADDAVTVGKISAARLETLAGMQSGTASKLADSTALTADIADLNQIDGLTKETTVTDDDAKFPTSGAVVDYVAAQLAPIGGLEVIADEDNFPTTQPASGVVISISDAAGIVVNGSGVSTTARTAGNGSDNVTINNFPSSLYSETLASGVGLMVSSTGSSHTYNYHKLLAAESDVKQLSDDINDFAARYRVASSAPSSSLDEGDLWWDSSNNKLKVYNGSAFEETASAGSFYINTISSSSETGGGSSTFNGSAYRFTLSNAGQDAQQHIVSVNGVIQKPNSGTSQPSEGFAISGNDILFASAPASSSDYFIITIGAAVSIGTPSANTVTSSILQNGSVTTTKIVDANVTHAKLANDAVDGDNLADNACDSEHYTDGSIDHVHLAADAVDGDNIADDSINSEHYVDGSIDTAHIADGQITHAKLGADCVDGDNLGDDVVNSEHIAAGAVDLEHMSSESVDEDNLHISNAGSNGQFLQKQSGNSGGLTWATVTSTPTDITVADESSDTTCFPLFVTAATGDLEPKTGSNLTFNSNTGALGATSFTGDGSGLTGLASTVADGCIYENSQTISSTYTMTTNKNGISAGPITVSGTVTIPSGSNWAIV